MSIDAVEPLIERIFLFLEDGDWDKANEYCERILDINPQNAYAYLGKLMVELRIKQKSDLATCKKDFEQDRNYRRIVQYGDSALVAEVHGYLIRAKEELEAQNSQREKKREKIKGKSIKILQIIIPIILIGAFICGMCFSFLPNKADETVEENPITYLEYKDLSIAMPVSEAERIKIENDKIRIVNGNFMIEDFLQYIKPPQGKSFYATGWAQSNSLSYSFLVQNYMRANVPRYSINQWTGKPETVYETETVDLQIYTYNGKLEGRIICKDGKLPLSYYGASNNGLLSIEIPNDGKNNYPFKEGETRIIAQYKSPDTTVEIVVVRS